MAQGAAGAYFTAWPPLKSGDAELAWFKLIANGNLQVLMMGVSQEFLNYPRG